MIERIQAIRGMNDVLPTQSNAWRYLESTFARCVSDYGYQEIRTPLLESTQLFKRTIGEVTDIVEKEMYTFNDLNGESISLRPEGTAGCVRACLEHGLLHNQQQKLWYSGPMFRHEKPQKGRYRQFNHLGAEVFGIAGIGIELELIAMGNRLWKLLGINAAITLQLNTLGELNERQAYRDILIQYLQLHFAHLDEDSKRRLHKNPLRILDSKNPEMQQIIERAPKLIDTIGDKSRDYFFDLCKGLDQLGIPYEKNPCLVRGLDYYGHTVFEWVTNKLGSQATVCAGGRFDKLVEQLGGDVTPAVGFAMGAERLLLLMENLEQTPIETSFPHIYIIAVGEGTLEQALVIAESLRNSDHQWRVNVHTAGGNFKNQFKKADKSGARLALILGLDELRDNMIGIKDLRNEALQVKLPQAELNHYVKNYLS